jgi:hypothetical protein
MEGRTRGLAEREMMAAIDVVFGGAGEMRKVFREIDWAQTSMGPVEPWSPELRTTVRGMLAYPTES